MKKINLKIDVSTSQDETLSHLSNSSIFLNKSQVVFKKDGFIVDNQGVKSIKTGEQLTISIDPKLLEIGDFLGSGASGSVHKATYKPTGMDLAIKSIKLYDKNTRNQFKNDLKVLLGSNQCENIVSFYGAFFTEGNVKILLEFMNLGSLDKILKDIKKKEIPTSMYS